MSPIVCQTFLSVVNMIETFCLLVVVPICLGRDENSIEPIDVSGLFVHHLSILSLRPSLCEVVPSAWLVDPVFSCFPGSQP